MKNYTTQTAALKATTVDTRLLDAKQIDTKKLFIDGKDIQSLLVKNGYYITANFTDGVAEIECYNSEGEKVDCSIEISGHINSKTLDISLPNYQEIMLGYDAKIYGLATGQVKEMIFVDDYGSAWNRGYAKSFDIGLLDDNLEELYAGLFINGYLFIFLTPNAAYYYQKSQSSSSTYSLRNTNPIDSLREKFEQMRQQNLDNPTE